MKIILETIIVMTIITKMETIANKDVKKKINK